jgi:hypothetical protein
VGFDNYGLTSQQAEQMEQLTITVESSLYRQDLVFEVFYKC